MATPDIERYANETDIVNRQYAERWGYGFHVLDHVVDTTRVPNWSKIHVVHMFLAEYDFLLWIDADAVFWDQSRRIEEVFEVAERPSAEMWAQDIWPDYPSVQRQELIDTGVVLFRNSRWTRQWLLEMYHLPSCQQHLNLTEQYCFTLAYREDLMGMQARMAILPTPVINHHILTPSDEGAPFIFHMAGRSGKARASHFSQVRQGRQFEFQRPEYDDFWRFYHLFARHGFGGTAAVHLCTFGLGPLHKAIADAVLFHFPFIDVFTTYFGGAPGVWSSLKDTQEVADRFPQRIANMDLLEYMLGTTRDGDPFVQGFFCDVFVLSKESSRHLASSDVLARLARSGMEGSEDRQSMGFSGLRDAYFAFIYSGCDGDAGAEAAARGEAAAAAADGARLDRDDEDGSALVEACAKLDESRAFVQEALSSSALAQAREEERLDDEPAVWGMRAAEKIWGAKANGDLGIEVLGSVALARVPRLALPKVAGSA